MRSFAIIPAAGHGLRMGTQKLLLPWDGTTVIERVIEQWKRSNVSEIVLVTRRSETQVSELAQSAGAAVVTPEIDPPEMKSSVAYGLKFIRERFSPTSGDAWLLAPADMPWLSGEIVVQLLAEFASSRHKIVVPVIACSAGQPSESTSQFSASNDRQLRRGHPVLFSWSLAEEVFALRENEGINALLARHSVLELPVTSAAILGDLDTPEDYRQALARH